MGLTTAIVLGAVSANNQAKMAEEQNAMTEASMRSQAEAEARAEAQSEIAAKQAANAKVATAKNPDITEAIDIAKKKKGVQSTFTATTGSGAGMMKGTTLSPLGGDEDA